MQNARQFVPGHDGHCLPYQSCSVTALFLSIVSTRLSISPSLFLYFFESLFVLPSPIMWRDFIKVMAFVYWSPQNRNIVTLWSRRPYESIATRGRTITIALALCSLGVLCTPISMSIANIGNFATNSLSIFLSHSCCGAFAKCPIDQGLFVK